jgi:hypothetical protein
MSPPIFAQPQFLRHGSVPACRNNEKIEQPAIGQTQRVHEIVHKLSKIRARVGDLPATGEYQIHPKAGGGPPARCGRT